MKEARIHAETWHQALRSWKVHSLAVSSAPQSSPRGGGSPARVASCPACRYGQDQEDHAARYQAATWLQDQLETGADLAQLSAQTGLAEATLKRHRAHCLSSTQARVGGWRSTPTAWLPTVVLPCGLIGEARVGGEISRLAQDPATQDLAQILEAYRADPAHRSGVGRGRGRVMRSLIRPGGWTDPKATAIRYALAVLTLAARLGDPAAPGHLATLQDLEAAA